MVALNLDIDNPGAGLRSKFGGDRQAEAEGETTEKNVAGYRKPPGRPAVSR